MAFRSSDDRSEVDISEFKLEKASESIKTQKSQKIKKESAGPGNAQFTDEQIISALKKHDNNKTRAAEEIGSCVATIRRRSRNFDI